MLTQARLKELLHYEPDTGVFTLLRRTRRWKATAKIDGASTHLGYFPTPEAANEAYQNFVSKRHGEFKYQGDNK